MSKTKTKKKSKIENLLNDFKENEITISEYRDFVKARLEKLLADFGSSHFLFENRIKEYDSIKGKLIKNRWLQKSSSIHAINDLVGFRIVFSCDAEIYDFENLLYQKFEVVESIARYSRDDYNAEHMIIKLKNPDNEDFSDMQCEIQLTTLLYYSWSKITHDLTYKPSLKSEEFIQSIEKQLKDVMRKYIQPAQQSYNFILQQETSKTEKSKFLTNDYIQELLKENTFTGIENRLHNIYSALREFGKFVQLNPDFLDTITTVIDKVNQNADAEDVLEKIIAINKKFIDIVEFLRLRFPDEVINISLRYLYDQGREDLAERAIEVLKKIASYDATVLKQAGYILQRKIKDSLMNISEEKLIEKFNYTCQILEPILETNVSGSETPEVNKYVWIRGFVFVNDELKTIRNELILKSIELYPQLITSKKINLFFELLFSSLELPRYREGSLKELKLMLVDDAKEILGFFRANMNDFDCKTKSKILLKVRRVKNQLRGRISQTCLSIINRVEKDREVVIYKNLTLNWNNFYIENINSDLNEFAEEVTDEYLNEIDEENYNEWIGIAQMVLNDNVDLYSPVLECFLLKIGKKIPTLSVQFLENNYANYRLNSMVRGVFASADITRIAILIEQWLENNSHLNELVFLASDLASLNNGLFEKLHQVVLNSNDTSLLNQMLSIVSLRDCSLESDVLKSHIFDYIRALNHLETFQVSSSLTFYLKQNKNIITEKDVSLVIDNLSFCYKVNHEAEMLLNELCEINIEKVLEHFYYRFNQCSLKDNRFNEPIPFYLDILKNELSKEEYQLIFIDKILSWFEEFYEDSNVSYYLSNLLYQVYKIPPSYLVEQILHMIQSENVNKWQITLRILSRYGFKEEFNGVFLEFMQNFEGDTEEINDLYSRFVAIHGFHSDQGFLNLLESREETLNNWVRNPNPNVKKIARQFRGKLNKAKTSEIKRNDSSESRRELEHELYTQDTN